MVWKAQAKLIQTLANFGKPLQNPTKPHRTVSDTAEKMEESATAILKRMPQDLRQYVLMADSSAYLERISYQPSEILDREWR